MSSRADIAENVPENRHIRVSGSPIEAGEWDGFVRSTEDATFCHLHGWSGILEDVLARPPHYLTARDEQGVLRGVLPMALHGSRLFGRRLVSMPFLNYGGPIGEPAAVEALLAEAAGQAERLGATLELRARRRIHTDLPVSERKVTVLLPLPDDPEQLWTDFKSKVRSQIRRPMKEDMEPRIGPDQLEPFYDVFAHNMRDLGTPVLPRALFEQLRATFPEEVVFAAVYYEGRPVAGGAGFVFGDEFEITWASALYELSRKAPNMLLYWSLMEEMIDRGVSTFNFGRCTPGEGTHRFKMQWGGHDEPLPWIVWPESEPEQGAPGRLAEVASSAWRKLPLPLANRLGPAVAPRLPWW